MIVVNSNVVAYLYLPGEHTESAEGFSKKDADWAAPPFWRSEFRNILAGHMRRTNRNFEVASELQLEAESPLAVPNTMWILGCCSNSSAIVAPRRTIVDS